MLYLLVTVINWSGRPGYAAVFQVGHAGSIPVARSVARSAPLSSAPHSDVGSIRAMEWLYGSAEFDAYWELGSASAGLTSKNGELKELLAWG